MSRSFLQTWLAVVLAVAMLPVTLPGQTPDDSDSAARTPRRRLPNYYGQIGVSERQRERIYALQAEYNSQIEELQARIDELKARRDADIAAVLTDLQKRRLEDRRQQARHARNARRAAIE